MNMTIEYALRNGKAEQLLPDVYRLEDSRVVKYSRYCKGNYRWRCEREHLAYKNFSDCYYQRFAYAKEF